MTKNNERKNARKERKKKDKGREREVKVVCLTSLVYQTSKKEGGESRKRQNKPRRRNCN